MCDDGTDRRSARAAIRSGTEATRPSGIEGSDSRGRFGEGFADPHGIEDPTDADPAVDRVRFGLCASLAALGIAVLGGQVAAALAGFDLLAAAEGNPTPLVALDRFRIGIATVTRYAVRGAYLVAGTTLGYTFVHGGIRVREWR